MRRRRRFQVGVSVLLVLALGACRQEPVEVVPEPQPLDFGSDPSILRGRWSGLGISARYGATAFSPGGELFAAGTKQGFKVWEVATETVRFTLPDARPTSARFSPDASLLALRDPQTLRLLSAETGEVLASTRTDTLYPDTPVFSPDGSWLATEDNERMRLWRVDRTATGGVTLTPGDLLGEGKVSYTAAFSPDSAHVLVSDNTGVTLWRVADGQFVRRYTDNNDYSFVTFGPDSSVFLGGVEGIRHLSFKGVRLADFSTGESYGYVPVVSPDGRYLISNDFKLTVWEVVSGDQLGSLVNEQAFDFGGYTLTFGKTSDTLYTASGGGELALHDLPTGTVPEPQALFRAETFALILDLTASYVDTSSYAVTGTFQFGGGAPQPIDGSVCVSQGLAPQALEVQTSPGTCEVQLAVGDGSRPSWTVRGSEPYGVPPVASLEVSRTNDRYIFEVTSQGER